MSSCNTNYKLKKDCVADDDCYWAKSQRICKSKGKSGGGSASSVSRSAAPVTVVNVKVPSCKEIGKIAKGKVVGASTALNVKDAQLEFVDGTPVISSFKVTIAWRTRSFGTEPIPYSRFKAINPLNFYHKIFDVRPVGDFAGAITAVRVRNAKHSRKQKFITKAILDFPGANVKKADVIEHVNKLLSIIDDTELLDVLDAGAVLPAPVDGTEGFKVARNYVFSVTSVV